MPDLVRVTVLFQAQAARTPGRIALRVGQKALSYGWLNKRANQLSLRLQELGVGPETVVSVCLRRDERLVVTLLAILKAGGAYLPLDADYPAGRLAYMHDNAGAIAVVTENRLLRTAAGLSGMMVNLDQEDLEGLPGLDGDTRPGLSDLAYVLYTSGSTGRPKGVQVEHRSLANYLVLAAGETRLTEHDCVPQIVSQSFDPSLREILSPLLTGGCLLMLPDRSQPTPEALAQTLASGQVTAVLAVVPSLVTEMLTVAEDAGQRWPLRFVATAGEPLTEDLAARLWQRTGGLVVNQYGPTECTMISARWTYDPAAAPTGILPIGKPIANVEITLRDLAGRPVPDGKAGEICVSGAGVARGYTGDEARGSGSFVAATADSPRGYHTGDLARRLPDGNLLFLGRRDRQVKIRGVRIEPAEIETALRQSPLVANAAVVPHEDGGIPRLVAYLTTRGDETPASEVLRERLLAALPSEMVPAEYRLIEDFPRTASGKIDRARLTPSLGTPLMTAQPGPWPAFTSLQRTVATIFKDLLGGQEIGPDTRFLDLGGDSLLAVRVATRIRRELGVQVTSAAMLGNPTVAELADLLATFPAVPPDISAKPARSTGPSGLVPLSSAQQRLWLIEQLGTPAGLYNQPIALRFQGHLDTQVLGHAIRELVARHEALRTRIGTDAGSPHQVIVPPDEAAVELQVRPARPTPAAMSRELHELALRGFDLSADLPLHAYLIPERPGSSVLLLVLHHIATDAWSRDLLLRELLDAYRRLCSGTGPASAVARNQYADYARWERRAGRPGTADFDRARDFWQRTLAGLPSVLALPADRPRPASPSFLGDHLSVDLDPALLSALRRLARQENATLFMVLHAAVASLLARMGAGTDVAVGTPVANRPAERFEDVIGFFANTLVLRTDLSGRPSFRELLARTRAANSAAYDHQSYPFDQLVKDLNPLRSLSVNPLFQVLITLEQGIALPSDLPDLSITTAPVHLPRAKFDLSFHFERPLPAGGGLSATIEFSTALFDRSTIRELASRLRLLLQTVVDAPDRPLAEVDILTPADREVISGVEAGPAARWPAADITELVRAQAVRHPGTTAVCCAGGALTYGELMKESSRLARLLRSRGLGPESIVAVALPRSTDLPVALLAILQAGAVYMPVDLTYPGARIAAMLRDASPACVITRRNSLPELAAIVQCPVIDLAEPVAPGALDGEDGSRLDHGSPARAGYVVFTSGSTGRPKGIVMPIAGLANLIQWHAATLSDDGRRRAAQFTSLGFDVAIQELLAPLVTGRCLVLPEDEVRRDIPRFVEWLTENEVNELHGPMSAIQAVLETAAGRGNTLPALTALFQAGEAFASSGHMREFARNRSVYNLYGPAETHVVTGYRVPADPGDTAGAVPIGHPVDGSLVYLLDNELRPVPVGTVGEIYLTGAQLARGYLNQPGLTATRFVANPAGPDGSRMYRTGDLARLRPDGEFEFIGRADDQVKIRGFRIELGEIETALLRHPRVAQAAVVASGNRISAYVSTAARQPLSASELRHFVAADLPGYMIPASITVTEELPRSPNGKVDRRALLATAKPQPLATVRPGTSSEELLGELFAEALGLPDVRPGDDFFDLGGHSITAAQLLVRLRQVLQVELTMRDIFEAPSAAQLAERLRLSRESASGSEYATLLPLRAGGRLAPVFCVHPGIGLSWTYAGLLRHLPVDHPVYGLQSPAFTGGGLALGIRELAVNYADQILALRPSSTCHLLGWSYGGLVAHAIAAELRRHGVQVGLLGLLDAYPTAKDALEARRPPGKQEIFGQLLSSVGYEVADTEVTFSALVERLRSAGGPLQSIPAVRIPAVIRIFSEHIRHMTGYQPPVYDGDLTIWRAVVDAYGRSLPPRGYQWRAFVGGHLTELPVSTSHGRMGLPEGLSLIGPQIAGRLAQHEV